MKKKFLTFMLALIFVIPCMFALSACGEEPHKHAYTHGLCDCGEYKGTEISANMLGQELGTIKKGETSYHRFEVELGQHYTYDYTGVDVKTYGLFGGNWVDLSSNFVVEYLSTNATDDGYLYIEVTNNTQEDIDEVGFGVEELNHDFIPTTVEVNGEEVELDENVLCIATKTTLTEGTTYKVAITVDGSQPEFWVSGIFDSEGAVEFSRDSYEFTFTAKTSSQHYFHLSSQNNVYDRNYISIVTVVAE